MSWESGISAGLSLRESYGNRKIKEERFKRERKATDLQDQLEKAAADAVKSDEGMPMQETAVQPIAQPVVPPTTGQEPAQAVATPVRAPGDAGKGTPADLGGMQIISEKADYTNTDNGPEGTAPELGLRPAPKEPIDYGAMQPVNQAPMTQPQIEQKFAQRQSANRAEMGIPQAGWDQAAGAQQPDPNGGGMPVQPGPQAGQQPVQAGQQPQQAPIPPAQASAMDKSNVALMAQSRKALELGRPDLALQYHVQGMKVRDQLRTQAFDNAMSQYKASGDPNAFVQMFNRYVDNGVDVDKIVQNGDQFQVVGKVQGKGFKQNMNRADMESFIKQAADPALARALEAKRAEELHKAAIADRSERVKGDEDRKTQVVKNRFQSVSAGSSLVDTQAKDGKNEVFTAPAKPEAPKGFSMSADSVNGGFRIMNKDTGQSFTVGSGPSENVPKPVLAAEKAAIAQVDKNFGADSMAGMAEDVQAKIGSVKTITSSIVRNNMQLPGNKNLSPALAVEIANGVQDGKLPVFKVRTKDGYIADATEYKGRKYLLSPGEKQKKQKK